MLLELQKTENKGGQCTAVCFPLMIYDSNTFTYNDYVMPYYKGG